MDKWKTPGTIPGFFHFTIPFCYTVHNRNYTDKQRNSSLKINLNTLLKTKGM